MENDFVLCLCVPQWALGQKRRAKNEEAKLWEEKRAWTQGFKSISRDLNVPVPTVRNIVKRFTAHDSKANVPGRGQKRKVDEQLQRKIVQMVDEDYGSTSKQIQADL